MKQSQIILTTDDYGVNDSINEGIINLVRWRVINSVEVLTNYGTGGSKSLESTIKLLEETKDFNSDLELGVHLTVVSGKPITNSSGLDPILCKGHFLSVRNINSRADGVAVYEELTAQVNVLKSNPLVWSKVTHITNHYDALWFYPEYTEAYIRVANDFNLPIRSPQIEPQINEKTYFGFRNLVDWDGKNKGKDAQLIRDTYKLRERGFFAKGELNFYSTHYLDSSHYSLFRTLLDSNPYKPESYFEVRKEALKKIYQRVRLHHDTTGEPIIAEVLFHVRTGGINESKKKLSHTRRKELGIDSFDEYDLEDYNGISTRYFDGRYIEYMNLARMHNSGELSVLYAENRIERGKWSSCIPGKLNAVEL